MPRALTAADVAELAVVERSGFVESRHSGAAAVLAPDGTVTRRLGDPDALVLPRSSFKPLQALGTLSAGAWLEGERLAIATASHTGTDRHVALVREILTTAGCTEDELLCPPAWPGDAQTRAEMIGDHAPRARIRMNCSGKHAAMLLACTANGWDRTAYLDPTHPLQLHIREVAERLLGQKVAATAIDGCGAPVYAVGLTALARATQRIATSSTTSPFALYRNAGALAHAVRENAWALQGEGMPDTVMVRATGAFVKHGAEGVLVAAAADGTTVALKILDGSGRAAHTVALALLEQAGALTAEQVARTRAALPLAVTGGTGEVGAIHATI